MSAETDGAEVRLARFYAQVMVDLLPDKLSLTES